MSKKIMTLKEAWEKRKKLYAEGYKLCAEGDLIWTNAVIAVYGNIEIEWKNGKCILKFEQLFE